MGKQCVAFRRVGSLAGLSPLDEGVKKQCKVRCFLPTEDSTALTRSLQEGEGVPLPAVLGSPISANEPLFLTGGGVAKGVASGGCGTGLSLAASSRRSLAFSASTA